MKTEARVIAVDGVFATVETNRMSACEGCHKAEDGKGCSVCSLMGGERKISTRADNTIGAKLGDRVMIESETGRMLWYAALVFLLPLLFAGVGFWIAQLITKLALWHFVGALFGFGGTFLAVFAYSAYIRKKRCDVKIVEIL